MKKLTKKGQMGNLQGLVLGVVVIAIILGVGLIILAEFASSADTDSAAQNATESIIDKLADTPTWIGILIVVVFAAAVLGAVYMFNRG